MKTLRPVTGLTQSVQRLTAECEVASSISGAGSILRPYRHCLCPVITSLLACSRGSDDYIKIKNSVLNLHFRAKCIETQIKCELNCGTK